jgi:hypothetical protein
MVSIESDDVHAEALTNAGTVCRRNALGSRTRHDATPSGLRNTAAGL